MKYVKTVKTLCGILLAAFLTQPVSCCIDKDDNYYNPKKHDYALYGNTESKPLSCSDEIRDYSISTGYAPICFKTDSETIYISTHSAISPDEMIGEIYIVKPNQENDSSSSKRLLVFDLKLGKYPISGKLEEDSVPRKLGDTHAPGLWYVIKFPDLNTVSLECDSDNLINLTQYSWHRGFANKFDSTNTKYIVIDIDNPSSFSRIDELVCGYFRQVIGSEAKDRSPIENKSGRELLYDRLKTQREEISDF